MVGKLWDGQDWGHAMEMPRAELMQEGFLEGARRRQKEGEMGREVPAIRLQGCGTVRTPCWALKSYLEPGNFIIFPM